MGFRSYFYGLAALVGVSLSSPTEAQENFEENCAHVFEDIPPNPFDPIPLNPFCTDEDLDQWREDIDWTLDTHLALRDPTELYPRWQRSAGVTSHRMEIPNLVHFNLGDENVQIRGFSIGTGDKQTWRLTPIRDYFQPLTQQEIRIQDGDMVYTLDELLTVAQSDLVLLRNAMPDLISDLWDDVYAIFEEGNPLIAVDFNIFFNTLLPRYTSDGVITPDEARDIAEQTERKIEQVYNRSLTDEEREALREVIGNFRDETNHLLNQVRIDEILQPIFMDPWGSIFFGEHNAREYREMGEEILSLMDIRRGENSISARLDAYARLHGQSDYMSTYFFHTGDGDYLVRHGLLNYTNFLSEVHFRLDAEFRGGRPLSDFAERLSQETIDGITEIERLLGYQPVLIDTTLTANLRGSVFLENLIRDAYEATRIDGNLRHGMGFAHGFVYRFGLELDADLFADINSIDHIIQTEFHLDIAMREEAGRQVLVYRFVEGRYNPVWFGLSAGTLWENLSVRERNHNIHLRVVADFDENMERSFANEQSTRTYMEQRLTPIFSGAVGVDAGPLGLFYTLRDETVSFGAYVISPRLTMEGRVNHSGNVSLESAAALSGHIDESEARRFHRDRILQEFSLFPARRAAIWDLTNLYLTNAMHGFFLESAMRLNFSNDPHAGPMLARVGLMFAGDAYVRIGIQGTPDFRTYGTYAGGGNDIFGLSTSLLQEQTYGRDSAATSIMLQSQLNLGEISLHIGAAGTMVTPELSRYLQYGKNKFGYTYTFTLEGIL